MHNYCMYTLRFKTWIFGKWNVFVDSPSSPTYQHTHFKEIILSMELE